MKKKYITAILLLLCSIVHAQERLTLQDAIARTLKRNFDINIAGIAVQQAERNNTLGNAGFSPNVFAGISASESRNNVRSDLANGGQQNNPNAVNTNVNPVITANWILFDGGRMFLVKKSLNQLEALSQTQLKAQVQTMVSRTIQMYAQVVLQQKQLIAVDTALYLAKVRIDIARLKYETGAGAKVDFLQAKVDHFARQADSLKYVATFTQACDSLSVLMGQNEDRLYIVDSTLPFDINLQPVDKERLRDINLTLNAYKTNAALSHLNADIAKTYFLPTLSFAGGYGLSRSTSATGFASFTQSYGANGTLNLSVPVFQGGNIRRQSKVASLQAMRDDLVYEKQNTIIGRQFRTTYRNYQLAVAGYKLAVESIKFAKENVDVQLARFRVGVGTTLESREAENAYVLALVNLYNAEYNVKVNETIVLELENQLVKNQ